MQHEVKRHFLAWPALRQTHHFAVAPATSWISDGGASWLARLHSTPAPPTDRYLLSYGGQHLLQVQHRVTPVIAKRVVVMRVCGVVSPHSTAPRCPPTTTSLTKHLSAQPSDQTIDPLSLPHPADSDREQSPPAFNASKKNDLKNLFSAAASVGSKRDGPSTQQRQGDCATAPTDFHSLRCTPFGVHT
jgi:hypothetical protein